MTREVIFLIFEMKKNLQNVIVVLKKNVFNAKFCFSKNKVLKKLIGHVLYVSSNKISGVTFQKFSLV